MSIEIVINVEPDEYPDAKMFALTVEKAAYLLRATVVVETGGVGPMVANLLRTYGVPVVQRPPGSFQRSPRDEVIEQFVQDPKRGESPDRVELLRGRVSQLEVQLNNSRVGERLQALEVALATLQQELTDHQRAWIPTVHLAQVGPGAVVDASMAEKGESYLEKHNRERAELQKRKLEVQLSESDAKELQRYRNHTPGGLPRYGTPEYEAQSTEQKAALLNIHYRPGFCDT